MSKSLTVALAALALTAWGDARLVTRVSAQIDNVVVDPKTYQDMRWRSLGPHRGGRSTAVAGSRTQPNVFYLGASGGGVRKSDNSRIARSPRPARPLPPRPHPATHVLHPTPQPLLA